MKCPTPHLRMNGNQLEQLWIDESFISAALKLPLATLLEISPENQEWRPIAAA